MNKKKKQFDKFKLKLKNLYFKKLLSIVNNRQNFNLQVEKNIPETNLEENKKGFTKSESIVYVKNEAKPNLVVNKIFNKLPNILNEFSSNINNYSFSKIELLKDKFLKTNNKINLKQSTFEKQENKNKITPNIIKNQLNNNIINSINTNSTIENNIVKNNTTNSIFTNTIEKVKDVKNKIYKFVDNIKFKYIEKPNEIKNINLTKNIQPSNEIDIKTHFIPSNDQIKTIKEKIIKTPSQNIIQNSKKYVTQNLVTKIFNNKENSEVKELEKQNTVYVLPAFQDGSDAPLQNDIIGKIHKNELILNEKQTRRLIGDRSGILPNEPSTNLTPNLPAKEDSQEVQEINTKRSDFIKNDSYEDSVVKPEQNIQPSDMQTNSTPEIPMNKNRLHIKKSLRNDLKNEIIQKNKMIPDWRSSYG